MDTSSNDIAGLQFYEDDIEYLKAELAYFRCLVQVRASAEGGRGAVGSGGHGDDAPSGAGTRHDRLAGLLRAEIDARQRLGGKTGRLLAIDRICLRYGLSRFERQVFLACTCACLCPNFATSLAEISEACWGAEPSVQAIFELLGLSFEERVRAHGAVGRGGRLVDSGLVEIGFPGSTNLEPSEILSAPIRISQFGYCEVLGRKHDVSTFSALAVEAAPEHSFEGVVFSKNRVAEFRSFAALARRRARQGGLNEARDGEAVEGFGLLFVGASGTGKTVAAHCIAAAAGVPLFMLNVDEVAARTDWRSLVRQVLATATARRAVILIEDCDAFLGANATNVAERASLLSLILDYSGLAIWCSRGTEVAHPSLLRSFDAKVHFPAPSAEVRTELWLALLPSRARVSSGQIDELASRYPLTGGQIHSSVSSAVAFARGRNPKCPVPGWAELSRAAKLEAGLACARE